MKFVHFVQLFVIKALNIVNFCRTIATMDIKLDFVPPSLINFFSRQLIGNGFRLYQKVIWFLAQKFPLSFHFQDPKRAFKKERGG